MKQNRVFYGDSTITLGPIMSHISKGYANLGEFGGDYDRTIALMVEYLHSQGLTVKLYNEFVAARVSKSWLDRNHWWVLVPELEPTLPLAALGLVGR